MPRNFGLRAHSRFREFWNGPTQDCADDAVWPLYVIGAAVVAIVLVGVLA